MSLEGELVILREEQRQDLDMLRQLRNDLDTQAWGKALPTDFTEPMVTKRFEARQYSFDPMEGRFTIVHKDSGKAAGHIGYTHLERRFSVDIGIAISKDFWGTGVALDAQEILVKFLFTELGVRVVRLWTHSGNPRAIGLAEKSGFRVSGRMREACFKNGRLLDTVMMDMLREEYFDRHPELRDELPPL